MYSIVNLSFQYLITGLCFIITSVMNRYICIWDQRYLKTPLTVSPYSAFLSLLLVASTTMVELCCYTIQKKGNFIEMKLKTIVQNVIFVCAHCYLYVVSVDVIVGLITKVTCFSCTRCTGKHVYVTGIYSYFNMFSCTFSHRKIYTIYILLILLGTTELHTNI